MAFGCECLSLLAIHQFFGIGNIVCPRARGQIDARAGGQMRAPKWRAGQFCDFGNSGKMNGRKLIS